MRDLVFEFGNAVPITPSEGTLIVDIAPNINNAYILLETIAEQLYAPSYFGYNWNALSDILRDLEWISEHIVIINHTDLPQIGPADTFQYLDVLDYCIRDWKGDNQHTLKVYFPNNLRSQIQSILNSHP